MTGGPGESGVERSADNTLPQDDPALARSAALSAPRLQPPAEVPGHEFVRHLGTGAFGCVWLAVERNTGKQVAIKFYSHRRGIDWSLLNREVEKLAALHTSRDVVGLLEVGWNADPPYYVMEYLPNGSLAAQLTDGPLSPAEAVRIATVVASALVHAHDAGILHCDVKPANVLLDTEFGPRLADFGQARLSSEQSPALGTLFYMAPEQADLNAIPDPRWDVYALGALLYHMLCGEPPFRTPETERRIQSAATLVDKLTAYRDVVQAGPAPAKHKSIRGVDGRLSAIVDRCLSADPQTRYANAKEVADALAARSRYRSMWPVVTLGVVLPLLLLAGLIPLAVQAIQGATASIERNLAQRVLDGDLVTAKLLSYSLEDELQLRVRYLVDRAELPEVVAAAVAADAQPSTETRAALSRVLGQIRHEIDELRLAQGLERDESWFFTDARGGLTWRDPMEGVSQGDNYSWRDYFHGMQEDHPEWRGRTDVAPIQEPRISVPFRSEISGKLVIAISAPVIRPADKAVVGILGRTVGVENLLNPYKERIIDLESLTAEDRMTIALIDAKTGLILDHVYLTTGGQPDSHDTPTIEHPRIDELLRLQLNRLRSAVESQRDLQGSQFSFEHHDPVDLLVAREGTSPPARLAAFWPVKGSEWVSVVQERRDVALSPVRQIRNGMLTYALAGFALTLAIAGGAWWFVRRAILATVAERRQPVGKSTT
ncbi:MAG: protein kinase [Planctomycetota bacterium]|nr:protein kinase [Planctomycetota bacterium]